MNDPEPSSELGRLRSAHQENIEQVVVHIVQPGDASGSSRFHPKALGRVSEEGIDLQPERVAFGAAEQLRAGIKSQHAPDGAELI